MLNALFYIFAGLALLGTALCITSREPVHGVIHLVTSFFSLAAIFYLLGAPLVAVFEVIIYAGAIMVLFLFIIMMIRTAKSTEPILRGYLVPGLLCAVTAAAAGSLILAGTAAAGTPKAVSVAEFSRTLFGRYGIAVEIVSLQLLFALAGGLYLGRKR